MTPAAAATAPRWAPFCIGAACPAPASATGFHDDESTHKGKVGLLEFDVGLLRHLYLKTHNTQHTLIMRR